MPPLDFAETFKTLTGYPPFPWQTALFDLFMKGKIPPSCNLPTGLGKTSIIGVWLIALANGAPVPRRLVYVVNRRTVVDQTTDEVEKYRDRMHNCRELVDRLLDICCHTPAIPYRHEPVALSTLRGQFADNREWSADPSRPAVICGTVDMIGSRLLFSGYGVGMKGRPLHAGFLGQDALLVHDEAHLEPAFQCLIKAIEKEQCENERTEALPWPKLRIMELTATSRGGTDAFGLTKEDKENRIVNERINARKALRLHALKDEKKLAEQVAELAVGFKDSGRAVLVFVRTVDDVMKVRDKLPKGTVETLTGTMRGKERDELVENATFARFLPNASPGDKTVYLVCTSAGEVGVNISADHMVCDLSTFESMAQRFGRVNRFGSGQDTEIHLVYPTEFNKDKPYELARERTLGLLKLLPPVVPYMPGEWFQASPSALGELDPTARQAAFAPTPTILPVTDILFDAWALTTIRAKLPGRPKVEPYLHGIADWQPPETHVAWREEVAKITGEMAKKFLPEKLLEVYPLRPHELLREPSSRAFKQFETLAKRRPDDPVWLLDDDGTVEVLTLKKLADKDEKDRINGMTVLLSPSTGGLEGGMLNGNSEVANDVADTSDRQRVWNDEPDPEQMRKVLTIQFPGPEDDEDAVGKVWRWFEVGNDGDKSAKQPVEWAVHVKDVEDRTAEIVSRLPLGEDLCRAVKLSAKLHDHGKWRKLFQTVLGNSNYPNVIFAKSGKKGGRVEERYRHEFGSLVDVLDEKKEFRAELSHLPPELQDLVLHLIAAHHGRARPHFPGEEMFDPNRSSAVTDRIACEVPRRFAQLQRKFGRWGLAYLESLLRAADWAASANPSEFIKEGQP
jgi:CRISPR-associated endonuclease/helicase Cas3